MKIDAKKLFPDLPAGPIKEPPTLSYARYQELRGGYLAIAIWLPVTCLGCKYQRDRVRVSYLGTYLKEHGFLAPIYSMYCSACLELQTAVMYERCAVKARKKADVIIAKRKKP